MDRFLLVFLLLFPMSGSTSNNRSLIEREAEFTIVSGVKSYTLPDSFVLVGSETIQIAEIPIDTGSYRVDYTSGVIELVDSLNGKMKVRYRIFPFSLKTEYCHRKETTHSTVGPEIQETETRAREGTSIRAGMGEGVRIGGKKTFSVSIGSKDEMTLSQSLELRLEGEISGVSVNGVVSDKDSDLSNGGTKSIEELDGMYMEVETDQFRCRIGDYDFVIDENRFCRMERKLEGVMGSLSLSGLDVLAAGAVTRRKFATTSLAGEDGKQGPYQLEKSKGTGCFNLVRGSERVYLDGKLLERGETKDYTVNYELGTIEFTPRQLITSESRIMVDFQYSADEFKKRIYGARVTTGLPNRKLKLVASLFTEEDDMETSLHSTLDERISDEISRAGSETLEVWIDGGESVGERTGDYLKLDDHYEYVGSHSGDYDVSFTYVGEGRGDYVYDRGRGAYEWVGEGAGSYVAQIRLPLPQSNALYDLKLTYCPVSDLSIEYEHAFSKRDLNTHSTVDKVRHSEARSLEMVLKEKPVGWGELTLSTRLWQIGREFTLSSCDGRTGDWYGKSNLAGCKVEEMEAIYSLPLLTLGISLAGMYTPEGRSSRREFKTALNPDGSPHAFLNYEDIVRKDREGARFRKRKTIGVGHEIWCVSPSLLYSEELRNLEKSREYGFLLDLAKIDPLSGRYEHTIIDRDVEESTANWKPESRDVRDILTLFLDLKRTRAQFNYTHRRKKHQQLSGEDFNYSLVSLSIHSVPVWEKLEIGVNSLLTSKKSEKKEVVYTKVNEGEGDYIRDPESGEYYDYDSGDYIREFVCTGFSEPTVGLKVEFQSKLRPNETWTLSSRLLIDKEVQNKDELFALRKEKKLRNLFDNTLEIVCLNQRISLRINHLWRRNLELSGEEQMEEKRTLSAVIKGGRWVDFVLRGTEELTKSSFSTYVRSHEKKRRAEASEILKLPPFTVSFLEGVERKNVRFPHHHQGLGWIGLNSIFVRPSARFEIPFKGSLESTVQIGFLNSPEEIPYILTITDPPGWSCEWITALNYWLNKSMSSTFIYQGEKKGGDLDHRFKAEIRGYF